VLRLLMRRRRQLGAVRAGCCSCRGRRWAGEGSEGDVRRPAWCLWGRNGGCWRTVGSSPICLVVWWWEGGDGIEV
jgi:hypothetical protein